MTLSFDALWAQRRGTRIPFHVGHTKGGYGGWSSVGWKGVGVFPPFDGGHRASRRSFFCCGKLYPGVYLGRGFHGQFFGYRPAARNYSSAHFVETWKDRNRWGTEIQLPVDSLLLSTGMDKEEVMRRLGSPIDKIRIGDGERWKYSSYTLFFSSGVLTGIR